MMQQNYTSDFKKKIIKLYLEERRTFSSLSDEYNVSKASISKWVEQYRYENQSLKIQEYNNNMREIIRLRSELDNIKKENDFLKRIIVFFAKDIVK